MKPLLIFSLALSLSSQLSAQITQSQTENFGPNIPAFSTILTFDSYTGDLSHIINIEVTWSMAIADGFLVIDNDAVDPASGTYEFGAEIGIDNGNTDVNLLDASFQPLFTNTEVTNSGTFNLSGNVGDGSNDFDSTGPDGISIAGVPGSGNGGGNVNSLFHSQYVSGPDGIAGATFDIAIDASQFLNVTSDGGTEYAITPVNALGTVTVKYTLVPEPSVGILSLLGGAALLLRRRRA